MVDLEAAEVAAGDESDEESSDEDTVEKFASVKKKGNRKPSSQPKPAPKPPRKSKDKSSENARGAKRVGSPGVRSQRSRKQPKLADEQKNSKPKSPQKGKAKARKNKAGRLSPSPEDVEADELRRAMQLSRIASQPGKMGSSSAPIEGFEPHSSTLSTAPQPSSTVAGLLSRSSVPPQSNINETASNVQMTEISAGYSVPTRALEDIVGQIANEDELSYYGSFLDSSDLPPTFVKCWEPVKSSWEQCGIFFGIVDESARTQSKAAYTALESFIATLMKGDTGE